MNGLMAPTRHCSCVNELSSDALLSKIPSHQATPSAYGNQSISLLGKGKSHAGLLEFKGL